MTEQLIRLQIPEASNARVERLLESLLEQQERTNQLLSELAHKGEPKATLSHREAAQYLGISVSSLQVHMESGAIPVHRCGTKKLYRRVDLENWLNETRAAKGMKK